MPRVGADAFIGAAAPVIVRSMGRDPIVLALANPEPADAIRAGAGIIATGEHTVQLRHFLSGYIPGALDARATRVTTGAKIAAARALAGPVTAPPEGPGSARHPQQEGHRTGGHRRHGVHCPGGGRAGLNRNPAATFFIRERKSMSG